ncbi:hypothetical protein [Salinigranum sp. GCM10025319]|uniref:hypothetical protein n=1 Tax=Salinigranum sp. GCM10025319 TaxID=3252687 RepID=UPI0036203DC8
MVPTPGLAPERSVAETLRTVETVVWSLLFVVVAALLVATLVGAFVVSARPVGLSIVALLAAAVGGTLLFVVADVAFE